MNAAVRRVALSLIFGTALFGGAALAASPAVHAQSCDPNYGPTPGGCVPGDRDYDCPELHAMGIGDVPVLGTDWQHLDGYYNYTTGVWETYPDGLGCEWYGE